MAPEEAFAKNTTEHELTILRDDAPYRHLRCRSPKTWAYGFDIVTWPGHVAISGDLGTYVFSNTDLDMLWVFRNLDNLDYLLGKCTAWSDQNRREIDAETIISNYRENGTDLDPETIRMIRDLDGTNRTEALGEILAPIDQDWWDGIITRPSFQSVLVIHAIHWAATRYYALAEETGAGEVVTAGV